MDIDDQTSEELWKRETIDLPGSARNKASSNGNQPIEVIDLSTDEEDDLGMFSSNKTGSDDRQFVVKSDRTAHDQKDCSLNRQQPVRPKDDGKLDATFGQARDEEDLKRCNKDSDIHLKNGNGDVERYSVFLELASLLELPQTCVTRLQTRQIPPSEKTTLKESYQTGKRRPEIEEPD
jgi:hypothetical protein